MKAKHILLIAVTITFASCQKKPTACFTAPANVLLRNDVRFTNCSTEAYSYEWDFGDGVKSNMVAPSHAYYAAGTYEVVLKTTSKNGRKWDEISQPVVICGKAAFQYPSPYTITVTVGSQTRAGYISTLYSDCYTGVTFILPIGTYSYTASEASPGTHTWNGTFSITAQGCSVMYLP